MTNTKTLHFLGYASDLGGAKQGSAEGPITLKYSSYLSLLEKQGLNIQWNNIVKNTDTSLSKTEAILNLCRELGDSVYPLVLENHFFIVIGGDHSSAMGTWSGAFQAIKQQGSLGLIWIDAHMDSHVPETTPSGNIHGMPLASLLGYGNVEFTQLMSHHHKLDPRNLCLIGVRSFEPEEEKLLEHLNVKVYFMEEIKRRGLEIVMREAILHVTHLTAGFGISVDIDSMDPKDAPATGVKEPDGIPAKDLIQALQLLAGHPKFIGAEIAEFDPSRDKNKCTEELIPKLISSFILGK